MKTVYFISIKQSAILKSQEINIESQIATGKKATSIFCWEMELNHDSIMNVNVKGTYFTLQKLLPVLNDGASVIFNTSVNAHLAMPNSSVYAASKAAVLSMNKVFAAELATRKIRVNAVSPGPVETPLYGKLGLATEEVEGLGAVLGQKILLKRFAQSSEIAKTVGFLASDESSFITGTEIIVDGGLTVNSVV